MDFAIMLYFCGIVIGYYLGILASMIERELRHLTYFDGYREGLDMALNINKSVMYESIKLNDKKRRLQ